MQYGIDASWQRFGRVILAGSPLRLFRVTAAGRRIVERIESGDDVGGSSLVDRLLDAGAVHLNSEGPSATTTASPSTTGHSHRWSAPPSASNATRVPPPPAMQHARA